MKVDVWVENHQPVPLVPLAELGLRRGTLLFVKNRVCGPGAEYPGPGWCVYDGEQGFTALADPTDAWYDPNLDFGKSLGRLLQPGEVLHVRYANE